jgi:hypothetical protein
MEGLGRVFNVIAVADGVWVPMRHASAVSFVCFLAAGDTFTVQEATSAAGAGAVDLATITQYYGGNGVGGAWTKRTQAVAAAVTISTDDCAVICIGGEELSAGFTHVKCTSTGAGTVVAVQHDLVVQRAPQNLAALV